MTQGMNDLFVGVDDPITEMCRELAKHDLFVVPGGIMRDCVNVLNILSCDAESTEEATAIDALISVIVASFNRGVLSKKEAA